MGFYFLSYLLSRPELSLRDVTIICLSVFLDGLSTTTPTALFCLYSLAVNPRVQEQLYREAIAVTGGRHGQVLPQHIGKMPYLKAFLKEVFRLWPNGTEVSRYTDKPLVLSGYEIPVGTHVDLNPGVHFKDPALFTSPEELIPERWMRQEDIDAAASSADDATTTAAVKKSDTKKAAGGGASVAAAATAADG